ncbi:restriction endonuclease subunit S [Xenorhabdus sp. Reich]|uniref:Restriction endonuclease subunit S n=1 Tax=Xenorhabdus littoralis TaxID=2582835 RepID=A0ABU4SM83_9GAMM|nr:restriction endonuclease subunit S [Xenorhabdus sp. Reich]MDX7999763.1 restriction endonuclease subunit S [Xenorhabdus sp. Reich]
MNIYESVESKKSSTVVIDDFQLPIGWKIYRFRNLFKFGKGLNITKENLQDDGIPCVNYGEVHSKYGFEINPVKHKLRCVSDYYLKKNSTSLLELGDFVFADTSEDIEGSGNFTQLVAEVKTFAGYHTVICRPVGDGNHRFLAYLLDSLSFRKQIRKSVKGVKVFSITKSILKNTQVWLPDINYQIIVSAFLDKKTVQLDEAIAIKEKQIALLKEHKQIIIQKAVTQGLDPNVSMKDSGVDWIGKIPAHWEMAPGFTIFKESKDSNKGMVESQVLSLSYGTIIVKPKEKLVGLVPESFETYQIVEPGDVIIRCTDLQNDRTSLRTGIAKNRGIITSAYLNLRVKNDAYPDYVHYFLHVLDITKEIYRFGSGLRQNLSFADFKHMQILQPSKSEQIEIVSYIQEQEAHTINSINFLQEQIEMLKEYKNSLINSAVTGKIKITPEMAES